MVYAGTAVTYGRGTAVVVATGMRTEFGKIARLLQGVESRRTPLQENLDRVGHVLARAALAVVALIVVLGLLRGQSFWEMLIFGIALAVAVVPEALPAVVTISLALGVQRMVKRNALVRRLPAVETLGSVSVIASDKTGTLTRGEMTVRRIYVAGTERGGLRRGLRAAGRVLSRQADPIAPPPPLLAAAARRPSLPPTPAQATRRERRPGWSAKGDPTEVALVVAAEKAGLHKHELDAALPAGGRDPVHLRDQADDHAAPDARGCRRLLEGRAGGHPRRRAAGCWATTANASWSRRTGSESSTPPARWRARRSASSPWR